eukprot:scaffold243385_cov26-Tisochrysis_lutea.AAC.1
MQLVLCCGRMFESVERVCCPLGALFRVAELLDAALLRRWQHGISAIVKVANACGATRDDIVSGLWVRSHLNEVWVPPAVGPPCAILERAHHGECPQLCAEVFAHTFLLGIESDSLGDPSSTAGATDVEGHLKSNREYTLVRQPLGSLPEWVGLPLWLPQLPSGKLRSRGGARVPFGR